MPFDRRQSLVDTTDDSHRLGCVRHNLSRGESSIPCRIARGQEKAAAVSGDQFDNALRIVYFSKFDE